MKPVSNIPLPESPVVLVPHAASTEGAQVTQLLIACGMRVAACDPNLDAAWQQVISHPGSCAFAWTSADELTSQKVIERILRKYHRLDAIVYFDDDQPLINAAYSTIDEGDTHRAASSSDPELSVLTGHYGAGAIHIGLAA